MAQKTNRAISGHVFKREGKRGGVWYAKYRLPDGRQVQTRATVRGIAKALGVSAAGLAKAAEKFDD